MKRKPNVIVCMCDQLRAFEAGCYGNNVVRTPNIDRLAGEGVRFDVAVTNNPVCLPARSSLMTGQHGRTCTGTLTNVTVIGPDGRKTMPEYPSQQRRQLPDTTLAEALRQAGYETALFGKWHIDPAPHLVGFDYSLFPRVHHRHTGQTFVENTGLGQVVDGFSVDYEARHVERFLRDRRGGEGRPFFMFYSISPPHMPLDDAPDKYLKMYSPQQVPLRQNVFVDGKCAHDEHWFRIYLWDFLYYEQNLPHTRELPAGFDLRRLTALYYGMTSWVDDMVGRLLKGLEAAGLAEDTVVVFLSDHGDNLGSHHLFNKSVLFEESIRIPMIFWAPGRLASRVNRTQIAQMIDVMPTVLELCGAPCPSTVQGQSLLPVLEGRCEELPRNFAFIETPRRQTGIRTPTHLYGMLLGEDLRTVADDRHCFYDLREDPYQQNDLARTDEQAELGRTLRRELAQWNAATAWLNS